MSKGNPKGRRVSYRLQKLIDRHTEELERLLSKRLLRRWGKEFMQFLKDNRVPVYKDEKGGFTNTGPFVVLMRAYIYRLMFRTDFDLLMAIDREHSRRHQRPKKFESQHKADKGKVRLAGVDGLRSVKMDWMAGVEKSTDDVFYNKRIQKQIDRLIATLVRHIVRSIGDPFVGKKGKLASEVQIFHDAFMARFLNYIKLQFALALRQAQDCLFWQRPENQEAKKKLSLNTLKILAEWEKEMGFNTSK